MHSSLTTIIVTAGIIAVSGCSKETDVLRSFYTEAGSELETNDFGNSTMNNKMVQTGQQSYTVDLTRRFAGDVPATVNFAFNSAVLDASAQQALSQQADWIRQFPEVRFRVYGHTDLVGSDAYNKHLGLRRAQAVVAFLSSQGISRSRLEAVASFGETQPVVLVQTEDRRNRRTVTEVSGFVKTSPLILNGKYAEVIFREYIKAAEPKHQQQAASSGGATGGGATGG
jgi:peptidoglycan-associated lipoprotein